MNKRTARVIEIDEHAPSAPARYGSPGRFTVLPWEDADAFEALLAELIEEHRPSGATEHHLVEELAGLMWRMRRVNLAEAAVYRRGYHEAASSRATAERGVVPGRRARDDEATAEALHASPEETAADSAEVDAEEAMTRTAMSMLAQGGSAAYATALEALHKGTREWWQDLLEDEEEDPEGNAYTADADGLRRFLEGEVLPWYDARRRELAQRPLIAAQAQGEAFDPDRLKTISGYEAHLDRRLERTLAMLLRLQERRGA